MAVRKVLCKLAQLGLVGLGRSCLLVTGGWLSVCQCQQLLSEGARKKGPRKMAVKLLSTPYDCVFFWILFALCRNWALNMLLKAKMC